MLADVDDDGDFDNVDDNADDDDTLHQQQRLQRDREADQRGGKSLPESRVSVYVFHSRLLDVVENDY